jgi:O-antigen/teichoic acid export membrane protein
VTVFAALFGYAFRLLLARNMSVADYGLFYGIFSFLTFFGVFIDFGITQSLARTVVGLHLKKAYNAINGLITICFSVPFLISLTLGGVFLTIYSTTPWLHEYFHTETTLPFVLFLFYFVTLPFDVILKALFLGFQKVKIFSLIDPLRTFILLVITGILFFSGYGMLSPFIAYASINILGFSIFSIPLFRTYPQILFEKLKFEITLAKDVFVYGFFLALTSVSWAIIIHTDTLMILLFKDSIEVGLYQVAVPLAYTLLYLVNALNIVAYPLFAKLKATDDFESLKTGISLLYNYLLVIMIPIALIFLVFPEIAIELLFGTKFLHAAPALRILAVGTLFNSLATFNIGFLTATGHAKSIAKIAIFTAIANLILNLMLIPKFGFVGASIATSISFVLLMVLTLRTVRLFYPITLPLRSWALNIFCGALTVGLIWYMKKTLEFNIWFELVLILGVAIIFYSVLLIILKVVIVKEMMSLIKSVAFVKTKQAL